MMPEFRLPGARRPHAPYTSAISFLIERAHTSPATSLLVAIRPRRRYQGHAASPCENERSYSALLALGTVLITLQGAGGYEDGNAAVAKANGRRRSRREAGVCRARVQVYWAIEGGSAITKGRWDYRSQRSASFKTMYLGMTKRVSGR